MAGMSVCSHLSDLPGLFCPKLQNVSSGIQKEGCMQSSFTGTALTPPKLHTRRNLALPTNSLSCSSKPSSKPFKVSTEALTHSPNQHSPRPASFQAKGVRKKPHTKTMAKTQRNVEIPAAPVSADLGKVRAPEEGPEETREGDSFTMEEAIDALGFGRFQALLLGYTGMAWVAEAMEMMLLSFVGPAVRTEWGLQGWQEGAISSVVFIGMMIGAYSWGVLSDQRGRRFGFFATAVLTLFAGLASAVSPNYGVLLATRFLVGVGLGGGPTVFSLFTEFLPTSDRGFWLVGINMFWTLGSVAEASLAWAVLPSLGWRWLLALSAVPLGVLLLAYPLLPESPRFLLGVKGDAGEARKRVARSNGRSLPPGELVIRGPEEKPLRRKDEEAGHQLTAAADVQRSHHSDGGAHSTRKAGPLESLRAVVAPLFSPSLRSTTLVLWSVFFANAFTYYGLVLLTSQLAGGGECGGGAAAAAAAGADGSDHVYREVFVSSLAEFPGLLVAAFAIDKIGRKLSMQSLFTLTGLFLLPLVFKHSDAGLTAVLLFGARASIMGAFTSLFIYAPEFYPTSVRSTGLGLASSFSRLGGMFCPLVAVDLVANCHIDLAVSLFSVVPLGAAFAVSRLTVETTGRALSDEVHVDS